MIAPPIDPTQIQHKGLCAVNELVAIVSGRNLVIALATGTDLERAEQYGDLPANPTANEHLPAIWKRLGQQLFTDLKQSTLNGKSGPEAWLTVVIAVTVRSL